MMHEIFLKNFSLFCSHSSWSTFMHFNSTIRCSVLHPKAGHGFQVALFIRTKGIISLR